MSFISSSSRRTRACGFRRARVAEDYDRILIINPFSHISIDLVSSSLLKPFDEFNVGVFTNDGGGVLTEFPQR